MENNTIIENLTKVLEPYSFKECEIIRRSGRYALFIRNVCSYPYVRKELDEETRSLTDVEDVCKVEFAFYARADSPYSLVQKVIETNVEQIVFNECQERTEDLFDLEYHCMETKRLCYEWGVTLNEIIGKLKELV